MGVLPQGRRPRPIDNVVPVSPVYCVATGIKFGAHFKGRNDLYVVWQVMIGRPGKSIHRMLATGQEVDHLALRVGTRIGPAGEPNADGLSGEPGQASFNFSLYGGLICLKLESHVFAAVVLDYQGDPAGLWAIPYSILPSR
jgi:hypothetical protein